MNRSRKIEKNLWPRIVSRVSREWQELPACERLWIADHVRIIAALQQALHQLFLEVGGAESCRNCNGDCCGHGTFHPNLTNLLASLVLNVTLAEPDFRQDCPYIGAHGCLFPPEIRPYNCISFICEQIEENLSPENLSEFYRLEKEIRAEYALFADRYVGAGLRGILIKGEILPSYLTRR